MKSWTLKWRLMSLGIIPLIAFVALSVMTIAKSYRNYSEAQELTLKLSTVEKASLAVHELQKERGMSASYLSGGKVFSKLTTQRGLASKRLADLSEDLKVTAFDEAIVLELKSLIEKVPELRKKVDAKALKTPDAVKKYTAVVSRLIQLGNDTSNQTTMSDVATDLRTLAILESAKENGGILRAVVSGTLARNAPISDKVVKKIMKLKGGLEANLTSRGLSLSEESSSSISNLLASKDWKSVENVVLHVINNAKQGDYYRDPSAFFSLISKNLDVAGSALAKKRASIKDKVSARVKSERLAMWGNLAFLLLSMLGISSLVYWNSHTISGQLTRLAKKMEDSSQRL
ncbi:MAG: nitrate- and nitrite sensing domain-containing protein [Pseudomonadota bacterium]